MQARENVTQICTLLNCLWRKAIQNDNAAIKISTRDTFYEVIFDLGILGPINSEYIDHVANSIFPRSWEVEVERSYPKIWISTRTSNIKITGLSAELLVKNNPLSLYACIDNFAKTQEEIKKIDLSSETFTKSKAYYDDLSSHQLLTKYPNWIPKDKGMMPGIIVEGQTKHALSKRIFIKELTSLEEAIDFGVFKIAKECGIVVPHIKVESTKNHFYLFSTDVSKAKAKKPNIKYSYKDLENYLMNPNYYLDSEKGILYINRNKEGGFSDNIEIDSRSIAALVLACIIFGLKDLTDENIGIKISTENEKKTCKVSFN